MLEMPRRSGSKTISHMLTSHGGEIFIHTLSITRSILEDPPSISEGPGGRVTDYRITDLGPIMHANRLAPWPNDSPANLAKAAARLARYTKVCPMTINSTTIFNMATLEGLQRIMLQEELTEEDLAECRKAIYVLISMENKGDPLPAAVVTSASGKPKTLKKEEQYKFMFAELERFLNEHARTERHVYVADCLHECRGTKPSIERPKPVKLEVALRDKERAADFSMSNDGVLRATTDSPMSPTSSGPPSKKAKSGGGGKSLLDIWTAKVHKENNRYHVPFAGAQSKVGEKAKLYLDLELALKKDREANMEVDG